MFLNNEKYNIKMKKIYLMLIFLMPLLITACNKGGIIGSGSADGIQIKFLQPTFPADSVKSEGSLITALLEVTNYAECDAIGKICVDDGALSDAFGGFNKARDCKQLDIPAAAEFSTIKSSVVEIGVVCPEPPLET